MGSDNRDTIKPEQPLAEQAGTAVAGDNAIARVANASQAILVLGMHRSGTSATARVLGLMGAQIGAPEELLPAHPEDNPTGYWERAELNAIHDRLLATTGHAWNRLAGFDPRNLDAEACQSFSQQLQNLVDKLDAEGKPWLAKDPRLCLLLSQWRPLLKAPAYVVVVRDPREIAASMSSGPRGTFTSIYVIALWEKYLRTLLADLAGERVLFVSYAELLAHPQAQSARLLRGLRQLGITGLHKPSDRELSAFLDVRLHRSTMQSHMLLSPAQDVLSHWLEMQCQTGGAVAVSGFPLAPAPDALLAEFQAAFDFHVAHGRAQAGTEANQRLSKIDALLGEQLRDNASEGERWLAEFAAQRQLSEQAQTQLAAQQQLSEQAQGQLATQQQLSEQAQTQLAAQQQLLEQVQAQLAAQQQLREQTQRQLATQQQLSEQAQIQLATQGEEIRRLHNDTGQLAAKLGDTERQRDEFQREVTQKATEVHERNLELSRLSAHATAMADNVRALKKSWSWRITAPLRGIVGLFAPRRLRPRTSVGMEQCLYRWYYSIPGLDGARKRTAILWLHTHAAWLTRHTLSYQLYANSREAALPQTPSPDSAPRMDADRARVILAGMSARPLISLVMPVYNVERRWLLAAADSVRNQFYPHWELCIADDASRLAETKRTLDELAHSDARIKIQRLPANVGIAGASNAALRLATGDYIGFLDNDDALTSDALIVVAQHILAHDPDIVYSDEDKLDVDGRHVQAHFKSDFNIDYFLSINYLCHFTVMRRTLVERIGGFRTGFDGAQDYDLLLRATERGERVLHIPHVLYHWRMTPGSTATDSSSKPKSWDAGQRALSESLVRRCIGASAEPGPYPNTFRVRRTIAGQPLVSILLPFRDKPELLSTCILSVLEKTDYPQFEILGIDNGSVDPDTHALMRELERRDPRIRFVDYAEPFNYSSINNFGASHARGEHLLLLNNDTEVIAPEWMRALLEHSQRPEVGVVGAKLLYSDERIQHAGVIVGIGGVAGHAHLLQPSDHPGYFARAQLQQNLSAVTFACAMTRREVFTQLGGLNERELAIAFNDIDYCLRAREAGYLVVYTPYATLYHHESKTRGYEDNPEKQARFFREITYMQARHQAILQQGDPYYNPNLRLDTHDFSARPGYVDALPR